MSECLQTEYLQHTDQSIIRLRSSENCCACQTSHRPVAKSTVMILLELCFLTFVSKQAGLFC